tara:strand:- start:423 stop:1004 length:582 start_codon:yes stop_codon:yes gene_type:complete
MPLTINTDVAAVTASFNSSCINGALRKSLSRISSGRRIKKASNYVSIYTNESGSTDPVVSFNKALLLSTTTFDVADVLTNRAFGTVGAKTLATKTIGTGVGLSTMAVSFFTQALENTAILRAKNGGSVSRLNFAYDQFLRTKANVDTVNCKIKDVDIAAESTSLAKYNTGVQPSVSISPQANNSPNVTLKLLG